MMAAAEVGSASNPGTNTFPQITSTGIYTGRFKDRSPAIIAAGKLTAISGDTAVGCLKPAPRPPSPDVIRKFRATFRPDAGRKRIFYGKAHDPHLIWAEEMTHGVGVKPSIVAGSLLNPQPNTLFKQRLINKRESVYASHQKAPLGKAHDLTPLPPSIDKYSFTMGMRTEKDGSAGELVTPDKTRPQVEAEYDAGRDLYRRSHFGYLPGEQKHRQYSGPNYNKDSKNGIPTPHDNAGKQVKRTMHWIHDERCEKAAPIISKRVDDFRERTQPQLGQVHDPIKDTLRVPDDHTFGIMIKPDEYGVGDLMHQRPKCNYRRGRERENGLISAVRQQLKKANYHNFDHLQQAFQHYDKSGTGKITAQELQEVCFQFNLVVDDTLLTQLMNYCDLDGDGMLNYAEFVNFLNWKDKMRASPPAKADSARSAPAVVCNAPEAPSEKPATLSNQIDVSIGEHRTSNDMVNAVVGGVSTQNYRCYGVPTVRTDLPVPRVKRVSDRVNYGDEADAYAVVNPSIFSLRGVHERDFLLPRSKTEIRDIFVNSGLQLDYDTFENLYQVAASKHPRGFVSVEGFRHVLDEAQATQLKTSAIL